MGQNTDLTKYCVRVWADDIWLRIASNDWPCERIHYILSRDRVTLDGVWTDNRIELLQLLTVSMDVALTVLYTSQITKEHTKSSQPAAVFTSCCLVAESSWG
jgi:hypothetical protein